MAIEYRLMHPDDMEQVLDLWVEVYPDTEREKWRQEFLSIPGSGTHTYIAVEEGRMLSTALLWVREMNDAAGVRQRVGNVSHVLTRPQARRRGLAKHVLELVVEEMEREDCAASILFTSEEARPLYEQLSWQTCPIPYWQGMLTKPEIHTIPEYSTRSARPEEEPDLWKTLAEIYTEFNQNRPFAILRDESTWQRFTAYKISDWLQAGAALWLAHPTGSPQEICGYLVAHRGEQGFLVAEMGVRELHRAAVPNLLARVTGPYEGGQPVGGRLYLPGEPEILSLLQLCFEHLTKIEADEMMVRTVNPKIDVNNFITPRASDAGMFWLLDQI